MSLRGDESKTIGSRRTDLASITIPNSVNYIGEQEFQSCTSLTSITLPSSLTYIGVAAFTQTGLTTVTIPAGVTSIGYSAFAFCPMTSAIFLGNAPTTGEGAFASSATGFQVEYYNGATGFTSPTWDDGSGDIYTAVNLGNSPTDAFGGTVAGTNLKSSPWFGYYTYTSYPLVYEYYLGYEYVYPAGSGVYLYDYGSGHFWYTQSSYFPFVYDFSLNAFLYYYAGNTPHRHFYDFGTGSVISE